MSTYFRPLVQLGATRPEGALPLAGGWGWFTQVEVLTRDGRGPFIPASQVQTEVLSRLTAPRAAMDGLSWGRPRVMGIVNVTPDSFSDGGLFLGKDDALAQARALVAEGADILDIGGESTRPGADFVPEEDEIARTEPVIAALRREMDVPISIDTRKARVAQSAIRAGATLVNDVSAFCFEPETAGVVAESGVGVCLMHAQGDPKTMQERPAYRDVVLDVYDFLEERIAAAEKAGIARDRIIVDPGIGFGKTTAHNLSLLSNLSLFHGLGCVILLGASRKRFIGELGQAAEPTARMPGSIGVALAGIAQGVQIIRAHDAGETRQAITLYMAASGMGQFDGT